MKDRFRCTAIVAAIGDYSTVESSLAKTILSLDDLPQGVEVIICCDGPLWQTIPLIQLSKYVKKYKVIEIENQTENISLVFNEGLKNSSGTYCTFLWPGVTVDWSEVLQFCSRMDEQADDVACVYTSTNSVPGLVESGVNYGWLQYENMIGLQGSIFRRNALTEIGGFDGSRVFQRYPDWDIFLRLSKYHRMLYIKSKGVNSDWALQTYPFNKTFPYSKDIIHRAIVGSRDRDIAALNKNIINVTVTGGYWEPHHNQLYFFNYFESEKGRNSFTWKVVFDFEANEDDIEGSDIVIISRGRHPNVINILDICDRKGIQPLYMIDDNWFTAGELLPMWGSVFAPGKPDYEVFLQCLKRCTATLVFSPVLEEYVRKYARKTLRLETNINLHDFSPDTDKSNRSRGIAGYVGSGRYHSDAAFQGLAKFIQNNDDWDLLIFSSVDVPQELSSLRRKKSFRYIPYTNYHNYARILSQISPDILIAPLEDTTFSKSKCPIKFMEITAAGAVGVYSDIPPYSPVIKDNVHGLLIPLEHNDDAEYWYRSIAELAGNAEKRKSLFDNAYNFVRDYYSTESRYDDFYKMIHTILEGTDS